MMISIGFFMSFISIRMRLEGATDTWIGIVQSAYFTGLLVGSITVERLIHRVGHIRTFAAFASLCTATILLQEQLTSYYFWVVIRFIAGFCIASMFVVIESWLLDKSSLNTRGRVLSIYMIALYCGQALGQMFVDRVDLLMPQPFVIAGFICALSVIPVCMTKEQSPDVQNPIIHGILTVFRRSPFGFTGCFLSGVILACIYSFGPTYAFQKGISVSYFMSTTIIGGIVLQWGLGKLSDLVDRRKVLIATAAATTIPALFLAYAPFPEVWLLISTFLLGGFCFTLYPLSIAQVCDKLEHGALTSVTGILLLAFSAGAMVGPLLAPPFMYYLHEGGLYVFIVWIALALTALGFFALYKFDAVPLEEQGEFVSLPATTPVAYDLDPRVDPEEENIEVTDDDVWREVDPRK
ncbi:MAG: MFS transporter [Chlamydiales bacterium]|nr:MFS transporter [Chlamydiales bacterium]